MPLLPNSVNCILLTDWPCLFIFVISFLSSCQSLLSLSVWCVWCQAKTSRFIKENFSLFVDNNSFSCGQSQGEISPPGSRRTMMSLEVRFWGKEKPTRPTDTLQRLSQTLLPLLSMSFKGGAENSRMSGNATSRNMGPIPNNIPRRKAPWSHSLVFWDEPGQSNIICLVLLKLSPWCSVIHANNSTAPLLGECDAKPSGDCFRGSHGALSNCLHCVKHQEGLGPCWSASPSGLEDHESLLQKSWKIEKEEAVAKKYAISFEAKEAFKAIHEDHSQSFQNWKRKTRSIYFN